MYILTIALYLFCLTCSSQIPELIYDKVVYFNDSGLRAIQTPKVHDQMSFDSLELIEFNANKQGYVNSIFIAAPKKMSEIKSYLDSVCAELGYKHRGNKIEAYQSDLISYKVSMSDSIRRKAYGAYTTQAYFNSKLKYSIYLKDTKIHNNLIDCKLTAKELTEPNMEEMKRLFKPRGLIWKHPINGYYFIDVRYISSSSILEYNQNHTYRSITETYDIMELTKYVMTNEE